MSFNAEFVVKTITEATEGTLVFLDVDGNPLHVTMTDCRRKVRELVAEWDHDDEDDYRSEADQDRIDDDLVRAASQHQYPDEWIVTGGVAKPTPENPGIFTLVPDDGPMVL